MTQASPHILDQIMARKREEVRHARRSQPESRLLQQLADVPPVRGFAAALTRTVQQCRRPTGGIPAIIAEIKRGSPSKGRIHPVPPGTAPGVDPFSPAEIARGYAEHGATCLSCLTDRDFFMGDDAFIAAIRQQVALPVLRKDFVYDPYQVVQSRALGADAILLILAVLQRQQAAELEAAAHEVGLDVLVEIHDEAELERAHDLKTPLFGINNRNLKNFVTSLETSTRLAGRVEAGRLLVTESGIHSAQDIVHMQRHGIDAFLIGEAFMREADPGAALGGMLAAWQQQKPASSAEG
ncbi:MAG: indole-3-glycerol phosphate synthase TrpC [Magnetococcales bacterium]|nr:indole-3-glycerol phosphate synthase TrpC [Magnetococcales bacterium]